LFKDAKRFCNKIWQAVRYSQICAPDEKREKFTAMTLNQVIESKRCRSIDKWIVNQLLETIVYVEHNFKNQYNLHSIVKRLRDFYYGNFCDFYLESTKPVFKSDNFESEELVWNVLRLCNEYALLMYHPFIPSITEELWQRYVWKDNQTYKSILEFNYPNQASLTKFQVKGLIIFTLIDI
jgi:valyl-tRNA synthetase